MLPFFRLILMVASCAISAQAIAATFVVDSLLDDTFSNDSNPGDGVCDDSFPSTSNCTLRAAIEEANALPGADHIEFAVAGEIGPDSGNLGPLPSVTEDLIINATNAPGWSPLQPTVYLDGAAISVSTSPFASGLVVGSAALEVYGLGIVAFPWAGIDFGVDAEGGRVEGCVIGLDPDGDPDPHPQSLSTTGIYLRGSGTVIGRDGTPGNFSGLGNVISGNASAGILVSGADNAIRGNIIGMSLSGLAARGNGNYGIYLFDTATGNQIGGGDAADDTGNHIANNALGGIVVDGSNNVVDGNTFGFKPPSGEFFNNSTHAIEVAGNGHAIGGPTGNRIIDRFGDAVGILLGRSPAGGDTPAVDVTVEGNYIGTDDSGGPAAGIRIAVSGSSGNVIRANRIADASIGIDIGASGNTVTNNRLGIDTDLGMGSGPGNFTGIRIASDTNTVTLNEVGNSIGNGMVVSGGNNEIRFNDIGFAAGLGDVGNTESGIRLIANSIDNLIQGNRILNNGEAGVELSNSSPIHGNTIVGNSIDNNGGIGVDFIEFEPGVGSVGGPTDNDPGDADEGANRRMNHPTLSAIEPLPGTDPVEVEVTFHVDADPANQAYPISVGFYRASESGARQGFSFLQSATFDTFGTDKTITLELPPGVSTDAFVTALATDAEGNTSEFSAARSLSGGLLFKDRFEE